MDRTAHPQAQPGRNANSGLVVNVAPADFDSTDPLAGIEFQRKWERRAFELGGGNYDAPVQRVGDFPAGVETRTSSPARVTRGKDCQSLNVRGRFPAGEGAGYAGGILSAAVDGIEVAEASALDLLSEMAAIPA